MQFPIHAWYSVLDLHTSRLLQESEQVMELVSNTCNKFVLTSEWFILLFTSAVVGQGNVTNL